jgi:hypothetical protein
MESYVMTRFVVVSAPLRIGGKGADRPKDGASWPSTASDSRLSTSRLLDFSGHALRHAWGIIKPDQGIQIPLAGLLDN